MDAEQLHDIIEYASVPMWPLAAGWWLLLAMGLLLLLLFLGHRRRQQARPVWLDTACKEWHSLQNPQLPVSVRLKGLAVLLRRVAIQRYGREACAGLSGTAWLLWLTQHDPAQFNWAESRVGDLLVRSAYMPPDVHLDEQHVKQMANAIRVWIGRCMWRG
ncbi:DUF4381 domain-containing protein [Thioflexithrix psekupsensis]|uniref:DUF4381 domain-containing protein n=1 Tax=Thioflexithrix psekupsensis TaxID=1570016 RepID=A0A251X8F8_9GAMM|nr:DUF4381 domain-containing protein [Thioflexithrix psekupsensis]OUD13822.1 hypothetical protein TPSD3_05600 [Thioflexithrix psekupsensis]